MNNDMVLFSVSAKMTNSSAFLSFDVLLVVANAFFVVGGAVEVAVEPVAEVAVEPVVEVQAEAVAEVQAEATTVVEETIEEKLAKLRESLMRK